MSHRHPAILLIMLYNLARMRRHTRKEVKMRQHVLAVFVSLCVFFSFTSAGQTPFLKKKSINTKSQSSITVIDPEYTENVDHPPGTIIRSGQRHPAQSNSYLKNDTPRLVGPSTTTASSSVDSWDRNSADTCGGTVNVPLSFDRLTTFESSQFPEQRAYPLICTWNIKVPNKKCGLARITMRVDGRSRLPDVDGCAKGFYRVYPFMKEEKLCGQIGLVPPFQWFVDAQQPENVTVVMENSGLGDGAGNKPEGLSFTLQGECVNDNSIRANKENVRFSRRWMNRLIEDSEVGEGPKVIINPNGLNRQTTVTPIRSSTFSTTTASKRPEVSNDGNIPWLHLQSPDSNQPSESVIYFPPSTTETIRRPSHTTIRPSTTYLSNNQDIPWLILKSPQQTEDQHSSSYFEIYPQNQQNNNNVKQTQETLLSTNNPWLALKYAYLRNVSSTSKSTATQSYYSYNPTIKNRSPVNSEITKNPDQIRKTTEFVSITTDSSIITTSLPTTAVTLPTTYIPETTTNLISFSAQQSTTLNQNELNSFPTFSESNETTTATSVITSPASTVNIAITSPAPTEQSLDDVSPESDANISYISLNGQKFIFAKLQRTFKRTYKKFMKIMF